MVKNILAVLTGLVVAFAVIYTLELAGHRLYPVPEHIDLNNKEAMSALVAKLPAGAFIMMLLAHALGSLAAGFCATAISRQSGFVAAMVIGCVLLAAGIVNLVFIPHPLWFSATDLLLYLPFTYLGYRLAVTWLARPYRSQ